jgi:hypothetical protein
MEKVDLTLDSIFAGDHNERLLPARVRNYRDIPDIWSKRLRRRRLITSEIDLNWSSYEEANFFGRSLLDILKYKSLRFYKQMFGVASPFDNGFDDDMLYYTGNRPLYSPTCHRCGTKINLLTSVYSLCYPCNDRPKYMKKIL